MKNKLKGINKNILMIVVIPILVALGVVIGGYISNESNEIAASEPEPEELVDEMTVGLDEFALNLEPTGNINRYIKLELSLSTVKENGIEEIENQMNKIRDVIIHKVSSATVEEVFEDEDKHFILKRELKDEINEALGEELIHQVYIWNIMVQ